MYLREKENICVYECKKVYVFVRVHESMCCIEEERQSVTVCA